MRRMLGAVLIGMALLVVGCQEQQRPAVFIEQQWQEYESCLNSLIIERSEGSANQIAIENAARLLLPSAETSDRWGLHKAESGLVASFVPSFARLLVAPCDELAESAAHA